MDARNGSCSLGSAMNFNYVRSARPDWVRGLAQTRIPHRLHGAICALSAAVIALCGAYGIETVRLCDAQSIAAAYQQRLDRSEAALRKSKIAYEQVKALTALDRRIGQIVSSGDRDAAQIAEIANALPDHVWLTGIQPEAPGGGMTLEGKAANLRALSVTLRSLTAARRVADPTLTSVRSSGGGEAPLSYGIHLESGSR